MNEILGARIRSLRTTKGYTQEQIAEMMKCTRQKYARIEKGMVDISYSCINTIAQILGVKVEEITSSVNNVEPYTMFRENSGSYGKSQFDMINDMIDTFYIHRKMYYSVRQADEIE